MDKQKFTAKKWFVDNIDKLILSTLTGACVGIYKSTISTTVSKFILKNWKFFPKRTLEIIPNIVDLFVIFCISVICILLVLLLKYIWTCFSLSKIDIDFIINNDSDGIKRSNKLFFYYKSSEKTQEILKSTAVTVKVKYHPGAKWVFAILKYFGSKFKVGFNPDYFSLMESTSFIGKDLLIPDSSNYFDIRILDARQYSHGVFEIEDTFLLNFSKTQLNSYISVKTVSKNDKFGFVLGKLVKIRLNVREIVTRERGS
ncbi:hypothetical protein [Leuconostoc citreum]|uniref:hypothetical protein n=1 Tax=Leuconostoc citreum TaxID=33964 RepID=UPI0032DED523